MNNSVNLCFLADDNYIMQTTVTINSIYLNRNNNTTYNIYIILNKGKEKNIQRIKELETVNFKINIIKIDKINELVKFDIEGISASPTAICKFYIPEILNELDKVLYIDGDVIILDDLLDLYNTDIKDNYVAAVKDTCGLSRSLYRLFKKDVFYFNSGVMLMNLKKMREEKTSNSLMEYRINGYNQLMDQDSLNYVLKGKVIELPFAYNTQLCCFENVKWFNTNNQIQVLHDYFKLPNNTKEYNDIINNAKIVHYSGSLKPWNQGEVIESELWNYYYNNSPFKDVILHKKPNRKKKLNVVNKIFKRMRRYIFMRNFIRNEE